MRARAVNQHYLGQNTLRDLDAEYAAGGAPNQSHAPRAVKAGGVCETILFAHFGSDLYYNVDALWKRKVCSRNPGATKV